jgi:predicted RNase H-like HicB family nuclease
VGITRRERGPCMLAVSSYLSRSVYLLISLPLRLPLGPHQRVHLFHVDGQPLPFAPAKVRRILRPPPRPQCAASPRDRHAERIEVPCVEYERLSDERLGEPSADKQSRVEAARERQRQRFDGIGLMSNADTPALAAQAVRPGGLRPPGAGPNRVQVWALRKCEPSAKLTIRARVSSVRSCSSSRCLSRVLEGPVQANGPGSARAYHRTRRVKLSRTIACPACPEALRGESIEGPTWRAAKGLRRSTWQRRFSTGLGGSLDRIMILGYTTANGRLRRENMVHEFTIIIERDPESGWLVGSVAELPGCYSQARTLASLEANMREAIQVCLETLSEQEALGPFPTFVGLQRLEVAV